MKLVRLFPLVALLATSAAFGCPQGMMVNPTHAGNPNAVGQPECIPNNQDWGASTQPGPKAVWEKRWGSMAVDKASGSTGVAGSLPSKREAERGALARCRQKGGLNCEVRLSYHNQCGALAWDGGGLTAASAPTLDEASTNAVRECQKDGSKCEVFFSDCSYAELVQSN